MATKSKTKTQKLTKSAEKAATKAAKAAQKVAEKLQTKRHGIVYDIVNKIYPSLFSGIKLDVDGQRLELHCWRVSSNDFVSLDLNKLAELRNVFLCESMFIDFEVELDQGYGGCSCCSSDASAEGRIAVIFEKVAWPMSVMDIK